MAYMNERVQLNYLLDFYGPLLTVRQGALLALYCEEDLSFSEIAAREGISRQAACDAVHRAARQLEAYESRLGLLARYRRLTQGLGEGLEALRDAPGEQAQRAREILTRLLSEEEGSDGL